MVAIENYTVRKRQVTQQETGKGCEQNSQNIQLTFEEMLHLTNEAGKGK